MIDITKINGLDAGNLPSINPYLDEDGSLATYWRCKTYVCEETNPVCDFEYVIYFEGTIPSLQLTNQRLFGFYYYQGFGDFIDAVVTGSGTEAQWIDYIYSCLLSQNPVTNGDVTNFNKTLKRIRKEGNMIVIHMKAYKGIEDFSTSFPHLKIGIRQVGYPIIYSQANYPFLFKKIIDIDDIVDFCIPEVTPSPTPTPTPSPTPSPSPTPTPTTPPRPTYWRCKADSYACEILPTPTPTPTPFPTTPEGTCPPKGTITGVSRCVGNNYYQEVHNGDCTVSLVLIGNLPNLCCKPRLTYWRCKSWACQVAPECPPYGQFISARCESGTLITTITDGNCGTMEIREPDSEVCCVPVCEDCSYTFENTIEFDIELSITYSNGSQNGITIPSNSSVSLTFDCVDNGLVGLQFYFPDGKRKIYNLNYENATVSSVIVGTILNANTIESEIAFFNEEVGDTQQIVLNLQTACGDNSTFTIFCPECRIDVVNNLTENVIVETEKLNPALGDIVTTTEITALTSGTHFYYCSGRPEEEGSVTILSVNSFVLNLTNFTVSDGVTITKGTILSETEISAEYEVEYNRYIIFGNFPNGCGKQYQVEINPNNTPTSTPPPEQCLNCNLRIINNSSMSMTVFYDYSTPITNIVPSGDFLDLSLIPQVVNPYSFQIDNNVGVPFIVKSLTRTIDCMNPSKICGGGIVVDSSTFESYGLGVQITNFFTGCNTQDVFEIYDKNLPNPPVTYKPLMSWLYNYPDFINPRNDGGTCLTHCYSHNAYFTGIDGVGDVVCNLFPNQITNPTRNIVLITGAGSMVDVQMFHAGRLTSCSTRYENANIFSPIHLVSAPLFIQGISGRNFKITLGQLFIEETYTSGSLSSSLTVTKEDNSFTQNVSSPITVSNVAANYSIGYLCNCDNVFNVHKKPNNESILGFTQNELILFNTIDLPSAGIYSFELIITYNGITYINNKGYICIS